MLREKDIFEKHLGIKKNPNDPHGYGPRGMALIALGKREEGVKDLKKAVKLGETHYQKFIWRNKKQILLSEAGLSEFVWIYEAHFPIAN